MMLELVKAGNKIIGKNVLELNKVIRFQIERDYYMDN